jgi:CRISPR system Cascade subunit CasE
MHLSEERMLRAEQHSGNQIHVFSVLFDGILTVSDPVPFRNAIQSGIGRGKAVGLGLFSVAPTT